uniref:Methyltransferase n=1 Tax=Medicago truncatula TaxID=3880 RepID=A2Q2Z1_MEDTR|nr:hypothetical protein MtrDRAFT_AC153128g24v2 [Medicago truncatula]
MWKARNDKVFNNRNPYVGEMVDDVKVLSWRWALDRISMPPLQRSDWRNQRVIEMAELFVNQGKEYADARPSYPPQLFQFIASKTPSHNLVWDVATGSGQAAKSD